MRKIIFIILAIVLIGCQKESLSDSVEPCECTKLQYTSWGLVIASSQVISETCESVGEYPNDIQQEGNVYYTINCYN